MSNVYIIRNHDGHYWGRGKRWADGRDVSKVVHFPHHDEVANTVFELSSKDTALRCETVALELSEGKLPPLDVSMVPLPDDAINQLPLENSEQAPITEEHAATDEQTAAIDEQAATDEQTAATVEY